MRARTLRDRRGVSPPTLNRSVRHQQGLGVGVGMVFFLLIIVLFMVGPSVLTSRFS